MPDSNACCSWFCPWINSCCVRKWLSWDLAVKMGVKRFTRYHPASIHEVFYFHSRRLDRLQTTVQQAAECTVWRQILATGAASDAIFPFDSKVFRVRDFSYFHAAWHGCGLWSFHLWFVWLLYLGIDSATLVDPCIESIPLHRHFQAACFTSYLINVVPSAIY